MLRQILRGYSIRQNKQYLEVRLAIHLLNKKCLKIHPRSTGTFVYNFNNNENIAANFSETSLFYPKCDNIITISGRWYHLRTKYIKLNAQNFEMWLTVRTVLLTELICTSVTSYLVIILDTKPRQVYWRFSYIIFIARKNHKQKSGSA